MRFFLVIPASLICANNYYLTQAQGRELGKWEAGTNPQVLSTSLFPFIYVNEDMR